MQLNHVASHIHYCEDPGGFSWAAAESRLGFREESVQLLL
jgi:hypothetical protein